MLCRHVNALRSLRKHRKGGETGGLRRRGVVDYPDAHGKEWVDTTPVPRSAVNLGRLLPALAGSSVLVLDNAPYHSQLTEEIPLSTTDTRKAEIVKWLECRSLPFPPHAAPPELLLIRKENRPEPRYTVDEIIRSWDHEVIQLPPAHPELNAIEQVWGCMKRHVRSTSQRFTRADLQARLQEAKLIATNEVWAGAVRRSRSFEEE
ncbi:hypothetical protein O3P69_020241 [Scylla paramamosain]|uniref:Tc1-like transposase DDE domain-containing protein n=1 Tax=Scylla paramamosain TaxID=85552 RepID=A0AAW0TNI2_SCYPA